MKRLLTTAVLAGLVATPVLAQDAQEAQVDDIYGELAYTRLKVDSDLLSKKAEPTMLRGVLGKGFTPWLNGELMLGIGLNDASATLAPGLAAGSQTEAKSQELKTLLGLYATPTVKLGEKGKVFARVGWANTTTSDVKIPGAGTIRTERLLKKHDSLSYGAGAAFNLNESFSLGMDYMVYYKRKDEKVDGVSFSLGYRF